MKLRTRMITLVCTLMVAIAIAPQSAIGARPSNPMILTPPYDSSFAGPSCYREGTSFCTATATAEKGTGQVIVSGTASDPGSLNATATGMAFASPGGSFNETFKIPNNGASSVTFTVSMLINSAEAQRDDLQPSYAKVAFFASSWVSNGSCKDCYATATAAIADSDPSTLAPQSREKPDDHETFIFELKSSSGHRLQGNITIYLRLRAEAGVWRGTRCTITATGSACPFVPTEPSHAHAQGDAVFTSITVNFVP